MGDCGNLFWGAFCICCQTWPIHVHVVSFFLLRSAVLSKLVVFAHNGAEGRQGNRHRPRL